MSNRKDESKREAKSPSLSGTLFVIAAASGSGKTSLVQKLADSNNQVQVSVSHTTRHRRQGEQEGVHYFFVSGTEFEHMIKQNKFLEYAKVFGNYYGTSQEWVEKTLQQGIDVILEIDWQGAKQVREKFPQSVSIFILPPSFQVLQQRLHGRNQDAPHIIKERLVAAGGEIAHYRDFDYLVVNDDFDLALKDLKAIVRTNRLRIDVQAKRFAHLLAELVKNE